MKIAGIVAEYNPFHNGHQYHIAQTKERGATHIVAILSGNYVQRAETAILDKWQRTQMALAGGADLIIELPLPWCIASAEHFARGAIALLQGLGCVEICSFGSESSDMEALGRIAEMLLEPNFIALCREHLQKGVSFPLARYEAACVCLGEEGAAPLLTPNGTLGIEYLKAIRQQSSAIIPWAIERQGAAHDSPEAAGAFMSASQIRAHIQAGELTATRPFLPAFSLQALESGNCSDYRRLSLAILSSLRQRPLEQLRLLPDMTEGLEHRLLHGIQRARSLEELYNLVKTKRYTHARVRRVVLYAYLGITATDLQGLPPYLRVLGFTKRGEAILRAAKQTASLPILQRYAQVRSLSPHAQHIFEIGCRSTDLFTLSLPDIAGCGWEMTQKLVKG